MALSLINIHVNVSVISTSFFDLLAGTLAVVDGTSVAATDVQNDNGADATAFPIVMYSAK